MRPFGRVPVPPSSRSAVGNAAVLAVRRNPDREVTASSRRTRQRAAQLRTPSDAVCPVSLSMPLEQRERWEQRVDAG